MEDELCSACIGMEENGDAYDVLMVGVGRGYPLLLGFRSEDKLPLWLEELPLLVGEKDQLDWS